MCSRVEHDLEQNRLSEKIWRKREERDAKFGAAVERHRAAEESRADAGAERAAPAAEPSQAPEAPAGKKLTPEEEQAPARHNAKMAELAA